MPRDVDRDARLVIIMAVAILLVILNIALLFYFRKKENDTLDTMFRMQDRLNQLEAKIDSLKLHHHP